MPKLAGYCPLWLTVTVCTMVVSFKISKFVCLLWQSVILTNVCCSLSHQLSLLVTSTLVYVSVGVPVVLYRHLVTSTLLVGVPLPFLLVFLFTCVCFCWCSSRLESLLSFCWCGQIVSSNPVVSWLWCALFICVHDVIQIIVSTCLRSLSLCWCEQSSQNPVILRHTCLAPNPPYPFLVCGQESGVILCLADPEIPHLFAVVCGSYCSVWCEQESGECSFAHEAADSLPSVYGS